jgi:subtilisin family serine protease/Tol biopolymer transport system component
MRSPAPGSPRRSRSGLLGRARYGLAGLLSVGLVVTMPAAAAAREPERDGGAARLHKVDEALRAHAERPAGGAATEVLVVLDDPAEVPGSARRTDQVVAALRDHAARSQRSVRATIEGNGDTVTGTYWLKNMVLARVGPDTLRELTTLDEVDRIIPNLTVSVPEQPRLDERRAAQAEAADQTWTWGLTKIGVDRVRDELGLTGEGIRVAVLDTGVDLTHPDLAGKLVTTDPADPRHPGGWMEFSATGAPVASEPHDSQYHGTHVAGTVVGGDASGTRIGVAPEAELMAGLVLPEGTGTLAQVIAGMEWAAAPYDAEGEPAGEPAHVVNMSLGAVGHHQELIEPTRNLYRAGIFPSFAIGNNCFGDSSGPGNVYEAVAVGATDVADDVPGFSCGELVRRGDWDDPPAEWPETYVVPDLSAPGVSVRSAYPGGRWRSISGTSMATPHVSGTVALMLQAAGSRVPVADLLRVLRETAFFDGRHGAERPNPRFGHGRIDAYRAVLEVAFDTGVTGTVTDARTGDPLPGVTVARVDNGFDVRTDQTGRYELTTPPGRYDLRVSGFGYQPRELSGVVVTDAGLTTVDIALTPLPRYRITGTVTVEGSGVAVPGATVRILDAPPTLTATTRINGGYRIDDVPRGSYLVRAYVPGLPPSPPVAVDLAGGDRGWGVDLVVPLRAATELVSLGHDGTGANNYSIVPTLSADGRYVAFRSVASNLVPGDTNGTSDVFVRDLRTGHTERVSVASDGAQSQGGGPFLLYPMMSDDARYVVWDDDAYNLVPGDTNETYDVFVHDRRLRTTERVSVASDGAPGDDASLDPDISGDGRFVAFRSHATNLGFDPGGFGQVVVHDRERGVTELVSAASDGTPGNGFSSRPSLSADGRFVAFSSGATNLVPGDTNDQTDIFVVDRVAGTTERVSVASDGTPGNGDAGYPVISDDGRHVAFHSSADNLVPGDDNRRRDVFVHDRLTGVTTLASVAGDGTSGDGNSHYPSISGDGGSASFYSTATDLVAGDTNGESDVFVHDLRTGATERVSVAVDGGEGTGYAQGASLTRRGGAATFHSEAPDLVGYDSNDQTDVFVRHRALPDRAACFVVWDLRVRPERVDLGRSVLVTARVKNLGEVAGEYHAVLRLDERVVAEEVVTVRPDRGRVVQFRITPERAGPGTLRLGAVTVPVMVD